MVNTQAPRHPPVVDLADFEARKEEITADLMKAATTIGFFYVKNHGIPDEMIQEAFAMDAKYFDQPDEAKLALPRVDWGRRKLIGYEVNNLADGTLHESSIQCYEVHEKMRSAWPKDEDCPGYRDFTIKFMESLQPVAERIMSCFAVGLGFEEHFFQETIDVKDPDNHTFLQYHKYPGCKGLTWKEGTNRITAHTDESLMTLLLTSPNSTGLELAAGKDGKAVFDSGNGHYEVESWTPCPPLPGCITVNVGDPLQFWSDGVLKSNYHRVRMPRPDESQDTRYSIGYFLWPRDHDKIQGRKGLYPPITMAEFMKTKGAMYGNAFHPDHKIYDAHQHIAFGPPVLAANAPTAPAAAVKG